MVQKKKEAEERTIKRTSFRLRVWSELVVNAFFSFSLKVIVYPKIEIMSSFTHSDVDPNLYKFLSSVEQIF